jgi:hypothetical protein
MRLQVWFYVYEMCRTGKFRVRKYNRGFQGLQERPGELLLMEMGFPFGARKIKAGHRGSHL